ncbi:MAG: hypothetical protein CMO04_08000 [Thalassospira sp.]|nr:hypothetical protein [Thalassospira sp.]|tara:strand:+ start:409 stop:639 length:231 start_codon:yes stop_codon:yes gene_type:complete
MTFAIAVPDATPVFTDWPAECKRQVTEEISKAGSEAKILLMVGGWAVDIEYLVGRCGLRGMHAVVMISRMIKIKIV